MMLKHLWTWLDRHATWLLCGGLAGITAWNWRKWRQDRELALRLERQKPEPVKLKASPKVSVLVAAWNESHIIHEHVESFLRLRYPDKELILCAGGDDHTYEIACGDAGKQIGKQIMVLKQQLGQGKQSALGACYAHATGDIILLTDADCIFEEAVFVAVLEPLANGSESVATAHHRPLDRQLGHPLAVYQWFINRYVNARIPDYVDGLIGANSVISREALEAVGAFSGDVPTGTDYHLAKRLQAAGYRIRYQPDSEIQTEYPVTVSDYRQEHSRWVRNGVVHGLWFGDRRAVISGLMTTFVGLVMVGVPFASVGIGKLGVYPWLALCYHGFLSRLRYVSFGASRTGLRFPTARYPMLAVFMALDFVTWASALVDLLRPSRRRSW